MRILSGNINLEVQDFGSKTDTPLVMISGYGSQLVDWPKSFINNLIKHKIRVIIFDNRDVGLSHKFSGKIIEDPKLIWRYSYSREKLPKEIKEPKIPYSEATLKENLSYRYDRMYYPEGLTRQYAAIGGDGDRSQRLQKISAPTLILHGASDNLVPVEAGIDTKRNISGSKIEILDGWGHDLPEGTHDWIIDKLFNHIKSNT